MTKEWKNRLAELEKWQPWKPIEVVWVDAVKHFDRFNNRDDLGKAGSIVKTVGLLADETPEFLRIAQSGSDYNGAWHPIDIPKAWILRKRRLS